MFRTLSGSFSSPGCPSHGTLILKHSSSPDDITSLSSTANVSFVHFRKTAPATPKETRYLPALSLKKPLFLSLFLSSPLRPPPSLPGLMQTGEAEEREEEARTKRAEATERRTPAEPKSRLTRRTFSHR